MRQIRFSVGKGSTPPPTATIDNAIIQGIAAVASRASLCDTASYGAGIRKFHVFCDIFSIVEEARCESKCGFGSE